MGFSIYAGGLFYAAEWSGGSVINLRGLPGGPLPISQAQAYGINDAGQVVGVSLLNHDYATEWSGGSVINLGEGIAYGINDAGQVVGFSDVSGYATEWSAGSVINLGGLPGSSDSRALSINDAGQAVGFSTVGGTEIATEWSGGKVIDLGGLPGSAWSVALSINDAGQAVGYTEAPRLPPVPESSTWAMMLVGFAGLGFAGYSRARTLRMS